MADPGDNDFHDPTLMPEERAELLETARLLDGQRPIPRPGFRGQLARHLRPHTSSPYPVRRLIGVYAGSGLALLMLVAVGLAGAGPLAAG